VQPGEPSEEERARIDQLAIDAVVEAERALGRIPTVMPHFHPGYDIESLDPKTGRLLFLEVKGKTKGVNTVTVSRNQILYALNKPDDFILAIVEVDGDSASEPLYVRCPFEHEPDFATASVNFDLKKLLARAEKAQ
jgi:hypothetical protein